jgi:hypothetical protein
MLLYAVPRRGDKLVGATGYQRRQTIKGAQAIRGDRLSRARRLVQMRNRFKLMRQAAKPYVIVCDRKSKAVVATSKSQRGRARVI